MRIDGRPDHIEDALMHMHNGAWFGGSDSKNKIYANLIVHDGSKSKLTESEVEEIKKIFKGLVESDEKYDVDEIEFWFENEGSWKVKEPRVRITNLSGYVQDKYQQTAHLRINPLIFLYPNKC